MFPASIRNMFSRGPSLESIFLLLLFFFTPFVAFTSSDIIVKDVCDVCDSFESPLVVDYPRAARPAMAYRRIAASPFLS